MSPQHSKTSGIVPETNPRWLNPTSPKNEIAFTQTDYAYHNACGISASDLKWADPAYKPLGRSRGCLARFFGHEAKKYEDREETEAIILGTLAHALVLNQPQFSSNYEVLDDAKKKEIIDDHMKEKSLKTSKRFNWTLDEAKEWKKRNPDKEPDEKTKEEILKKAQARQIGARPEFSKRLGIYQQKKKALPKWKQFIDEDLPNTAKLMKDVARNCPDPILSELLGHATKRNTECSMYAVTQIGDHQVQLKGRIDYIPTDVQDDSIVDYKTTDSAHIDDFSRQVRNLCYEVSLGSYMNICKILDPAFANSDKEPPFNLTRNRFIYIVQETVWPYLITSYEAPDVWVNYGMVRHQSLLQKVVKAITEGDPTDAEWVNHVESEYAQEGLRMLEPFRLGQAFETHIQELFQIQKLLPEVVI